MGAMPGNRKQRIRLEKGQRQKKVLEIVKAEMQFNENLVMQSANVKNIQENKSLQFVSSQCMHKHLGQ